MKTPRHTEPPARDDDGRLLSSPAVCPSCRCRPVRVVAYTNEQGAKAYRSSTSCRECQEAAFGGGSAPAAPAVVVLTVGTATKLLDDVRALAAKPSPGVVAVDSAPISETRAVPRPITPLTSEETITALAASVERVAPPPSVTAADLSRHAVRMRKAGLPVAELDPHERARLSLSRSHRIGCAS